jgi:hypothetical protein
MFVSNCMERISLDTIIKWIVKNDVDESSNDRRMI